MHSRDLRRNYGGNYNNYGNNKRGGPVRNHVIPSEPPFTAYIGNAPDTMVQGDFEHYLFVGLKVKQVRLIRDRQTDRFRGFAYVDFEDADSLRSAIALDGTCINDQPIRIDVATRTLGETKSEGFRNKSGFGSRNGPRQQSSGHNNNNNRSGGGFSHDGQGNNDQQKITQDINDGYNENGYNDDYYNQDNSKAQKNLHQINERQSQADKEQTPPTSRKVSDDVFITSDDNENHEHINITTMTRQQTRNWADCPMDDSVVETSSSSPSNLKNTLTNDDVDDIQFVCDKTSKLHTSSRLMGNQSMRGRNSRGFPSSQISNDDRLYYDQMPSSYSNQSQQYYHPQNSQVPSSSLHMGLSYHQNRNQISLGSRQKTNSNNRNYQDEQSYRGDGKRLTSTTNNNSLPDTNMNTISSGIIKKTIDYFESFIYLFISFNIENRPRLQLLPRSQKVSPSVDEKPSVEPAARNINIFGLGKPRDEHDPKLAELNKHIEEIVEKEQFLPRTISTTSNESTNNVIKYVY
ncbi:unnamed protein product [Rotaria sp. Silwood2]|nr:unnamed protein product [Rotaria sp. Silwood2]CAF3939256.1 unnamed protein product [Rotaria sp. Silwood2]